METYLLHLHHRSAGFISSPLSTRILLPTAIPLPPRRNPSILPARSSNGREAGGQPLQAQPAPAPPATETATIYDDNWFDRLAINYMSSSIQATLGTKEMKKKGYDGLVEAAAVIWRSHGAIEQQEIVLQALNKAFPEFFLSMIRVVAVAAPSKFSRELFSRFTTIFFSWLVGPCEVRESEVLGSRENNVVYIRKCRFLEATNCVGMCTNLCKLPSQKFIKNSLGMPTSLVPNFGDQSCEIIFGQLPPTDDPALKQPCNHKSCKARLTRGVDCSS